MGRTFACSDLHGMYIFYKKIKEFLKPEDVVYFLGDAGDRGPDSWKTIKAIMEDPQFIYLKGNHEDMLAAALKDPSYYSLLRMNGGDQTYKDALREPDIDFWIDKLENLEVMKGYTNIQGQKIVLTHAGFTPHKGYEHTYRGLIWDRCHIYDRWIECDDYIIVHGHTPIEYLLEDIDPAGVIYGEVEPGAFWYCDDHKCCIDCGAVFTGQCVLLDLDTWDEEIFTISELEKAFDFY